MGYGVPAAVAASILFPERLVIGFVGDGGFLMSGLELGTAMQYNAKPIIIIFNNENYGTIRMHQEREYPGRVYGTNLKNPDFCALGASFNAFTQHVNETKDFIPAVKKAMDSKDFILGYQNLDSSSLL